ncbi:MAG TPA: transporter substrate-binding domain-containing protein [Opitutaceae bacterium]|nr:transporter substrate-binding domain-containing protein [Opitutaceae bacterium]HRJ48165.1 transporter substrate-binding domain-containing protein [Opitutaceae bacterium]
MSHPRLLITLSFLSFGLLLATAKPIRVGVEIDSAPLSFPGKDGRHTGFTVELLQEMAKAGNLELEIVPHYWTQLLHGFRSGEIDVLANVVITPERRPVMDFTIGHAKVHGVVYQPRNQPPLRRTADFAGKKIGTLNGTIAHHNAMANRGWGAEIVGYNSWQAPLDATERGEIDATLMLSPVSSRIANPQNLRVELIEDIFHQYHMGVRKGEAELLAQLNEALATVRHNGTFDRLFAKWIGPIEPRPLRFADIRPYLFPAAVGMTIVLLIIWWQRHILRRVARQAEALRLSEERLKFAIESSGDGVWDWDAATGKVLRSGRWKEMLGYAEADIGDGLDDWRNLIHPDDLAIVISQQQAHHEGRTPNFSVEHRLRCKDGTWKWILNRGKVVQRDAKGQPLRVIGTHTDLTTRKQAEEDRLVLSKLESTGILAGGIAHDFNNLLAVILLNLDLAEMTGDNPAAIKTRLQEAKKASLAARHLTQQLITFARGGAALRRPLNLNRVVQESVDLALSGSHLGHELRLANDLRAVEADDGQIGQVVRNLVINARESMTEGGQLTVRTENVRLPEDNPHGLPPGDYVQMSVSDTGHGIPAAALPKIFDPYFSTKDRGVQKGMGLGLTICHSVVQQHQGTITVDSTPRGTTFRVYLPALATTARDSGSPFSGGTRPAATGRILVMDDEANIRDTLGRTLDKLGYKLELAEEGGAAVARYQEARQAGAGFDAVILDLTVRGGMGGLDTLRALQAVDPSVRAVVMSGYANATELRDFARLGFKAALTKPFTLETLRTTLARTLSNESG